MTDSPYFQPVTIDATNSHHNVWFCEKMGQWRWSLVWEDGGPMGTHMHSGIATSEAEAFASLEKTTAWIEEKWPSEEFFEGGGG